MNCAKKKIIISLICIVICVLVSASGSTATSVVSTDIPLVLCSLLCGFPWGLLAGILECIVEGLLFGAQGSFILANVCRMIVALLIPSLLSNKIRTNLSSSGTPTVKGIILALIPTEIVSYIATILYIWIMVIRPYEGSTFNPYPTLYTLTSFIITIAVVTPIVMLLNANKSNSHSRNLRSFDDER